MSDAVEDLPATKAERLAIAGAVAPTLRQRAGAGRKITVVDKDGKPVRVTDDVEIAKGLLARADIEFSVVPGERPKWVRCSNCGKPIKVSVRGRIRRVCKFKKGQSACLARACADCGVPIDRRSKGRCVRCNRLHILAQNRSDKGRKVLASLTPEQRQRGRERGATARRKPAAARACVDCSAPVGRRCKTGRCGRCNSAAFNATGRAAITPEQRSERTRRANATRRKRALGESNERPSKETGPDRRMA